MTTDMHPVNILMILDGWGVSRETRGNACALAKAPFLKRLKTDFPCCELLCSGEAVGLPDGTMGNSEVGHMNIGAGRRVLQSLVRINEAIKDQSFFKNPELVRLMQQVSQKDQSLHLIGLLSDGGVHSHMSHLTALIDMARQNNITHLFIHPILDGRDTPPHSGIEYVRQLKSFMDQRQYGKIASIVGRYWAMDRDTRWDRVQKAYDLFTNAKGTIESDPIIAIQKSYDADQTDEFVHPVIIATGADDQNSPSGTIKDGDGIVFFNFRADRAKEITRAFTQKNFTEFKRENTPELSGFVCMTQYDETFDLPVAFGPQHLDNILGEILSKHHIPQLRIAETEKYAHVTYFFNGGDEKIFPGEERILIPSPRDVATYDQKPEMSAFEVAQMACEKIQSGDFEFIVLNFANMDMVGHTGVLEAAIKGCETVDACVQMVVEQIWKTGGTALVTADHGNSEQMIATDGSPHTAHTLNPVNLILAGQKYKHTPLKNGILGDIAPTILKILGLEQPPQMTGSSLI
ncbi:MAG: 2,3-bisphosphoglycerate-independent phosphoglycerate mutase [Proteobacteria bacterium]|nr:2,3-bisphosphoglycerate-independent phosphoglycerate mutase [Pseudomonadota bacterium]MBU1387576.1 2,3-bisphosphoglycerate-independent phosphoglycerate mutase [Pseudomonadota bacterium]MBU1544051.1 2,3-bisphosphoglycerate-independent phosphoglycerate mutase [Pseudomonadota bacterium]MBU2479793.1 2,3-bisphosphoglycerate-independent phosphoglycerate mutase [Pseudomonadota bacterium]